MNNNNTQTPNQHYALAVAYDGRNYSGWQIQNNTASVQEILEAALSKVANESIKIFCAGRTDAGVHATSQIVGFSSSAKRSLDQWLLGGNANLPADIRIQWLQPMVEDFHARFSALERHYCYIIYNCAIAPCTLRKLVTWHIKPLDFAKMHTAGQLLIGEHDFSSFRSSHCQAKQPVRTVKTLTITQPKPDYICLTISANAFLHHMVRNIVGSLLKIGEGTHDQSWLAEILAAKDRTLAGITAPADGLYLTGVIYPEQFQLTNKIITPPIL